MKRTYIKDLTNFKEKEVSISGWIDVRRDQGKMIFFDIRDESGKIQGVILSGNKEALEIGSTLRPEWVVRILGKVNSRPENAVQKDRVNGDIEIEILEIEILNQATTPPFDISESGMEMNEESRMKQRHIDMRRERVQKNIRNRHLITQFTRDFYTKEGFVEIETPLLTKTTPEGSRDYVVPTRLQGKFYALPQSPQQYKQILMSGGFEKYFQIARCFRDEDTRGDRQPEFTQIDMEMGFVEQVDVMDVNERFAKEMIRNIYPEKKIQSDPFPVLTFSEVMEKYGTDKPDFRADKNDPNELAFCWVINHPFFEKTDTGAWTFTHNPFSAPLPEFMNDLLEKKDVEKIIAAQYDLVLNGYEIGGGSIRNHKPEGLKKVFEIMGYSEDRINENFGHMLDILGSGTPPHGGIAFGLDRLVMILQNEPNIREVIAFAKTGEGRDLLMDSPSEIQKEQLDELGILLKKKED